MSELIDTVKDSVSSVFKGGGNKKKNLLIFGGIGAAIVGLALFMRSRGGDTGGVAADASGVGDDTSGSGAADLSGLIEGFGGEIDRLDARIANLGATGTNYTTITPSPAPAPNLDTMAAYAPVADEPMVSTASPLTADIVPAVADVIQTKSVLPQTVAVAPAPAPAARVSSAYAPAPSVSPLVIAPRPADFVPVTTVTAVRNTPAAIAPVGSSAAATLANPLAPAGAKQQAAQSVAVKPLQPVAAAKPVAAIAPVGSSAAATLANPLAPAGAKQQAAQSVSVKPVAATKPAAAPAIKPAPAPSTAGAAITLKKPVVKAPAASPVINSQSAYDAYMRTR